MTFSVFSAFSQNLVKNGSFEIITNNLPRIIPYDPDNWTDFSLANSYCWINRSIGFCNNPDLFLSPQPPNCVNWYAPTLGSPDYYHRNADNSAIHVKVPDIKLFGGTNREMRQPYGYEIDQNQNAFCGILLLDKNETNYNGFRAQYREYIQSQTELTLQKNKYYKVSFKVSRSWSDSRNGYIYKLGAFISPTPVINMTNEAYPLQVTPQIESNFPLTSRADANGLGGWDLIEGYFYDDLNDNNFITIGNFEQNTLTFTRNRIDQNYPSVYYFIDDLKIEEMDVSDTCQCDSTFYKFTWDAKQNQINETNCCYKFQLKVADDEFGYSCPLMNFKILQIDFSTPPNEKIELYDHGQSVPWGSTIQGEFCIPKSPVNDYWKRIMIEYYDGNGIMETCTMVKEMECECPCVNDDGIHNIEKNIKIIKTSNSGKCCYEIWFDNSNLLCHFNDHFKYVNISKDVMNQDYGGLTYIPGLWDYWEHIELNYTKKGYVRPANFKIFPYQQPFLIGTFCHDADNIEHNYYLWFSNLLPDHGGIAGCLVMTGKFKCEGTTTNCCQTLSVNLSLDPINSAPGECFYTLRVNQLHTPTNDCDVYSIKIFNRGDRQNPINIFNSQFQNKPLQLSNPSGTYMRYFLMGYQQEIHYDICFYGQQGQELCCFPIDAQCNNVPGEWGHSRKSTGELESGGNTVNEFISNVHISPNPSNGSVNLSFDLKENCYVEIEIFNTLGNKVKTLYKGELAKSENYKFSSDLQELSNGKYKVKISCNGNILLYPFILLK